MPRLKRLRLVWNCDSQVINEEHIRLDQICSQVPDMLDTSIHGIHRSCYQSFTNISTIQKRKHTQSDKEEKEVSIASKRSRQSESSRLFPADECIFCGKMRKWVRRRFELLVKCVTSTAEQSIKKAAESKGDEKLLREIRNKDLIAREAMYHNTCRRVYTRKMAQTSEEAEAGTSEQQEAHMKTFEFICNYVDSAIIKGSNVERITMLREKYLNFLKENYPKLYNPNYKTYKLKDKLSRHFGTQIQFWQPNFRSELVFQNIY